jgi:hypothetical protein
MLSDEAVGFVILGALHNTLATTLRIARREWNGTVRHFAGIKYLSVLSKSIHPTHSNAITRRSSSPIPVIINHSVISVLVL